MKLHFYGASRQVTGSRYLVETSQRRVLVDCGMFQERRFLERNWVPPPVPPQSIDVVLLTHAHLDHCGLLPKLVRFGYEGEILATPPSIDLAKIVLLDSARIQAEDAAQKRRRHAREKRSSPHEPVALYTPEDAEATIGRLRMVHYGEPIDLGGGIEATYHDAGHILGSAMIELAIDDGGRPRRIIFSGDIGQWSRPIMHEPTTFDRADAVVMESTYGDREHGDATNILDELQRVVLSTLERGGNLLIPTFAIDRAQEVMYYLSLLTRDERIPRVTIFLDSPMAIDATTVYKRYPHLLDEDAHALFDAGLHPFQFPGLHFVRGSRESMAINSIRGSAIIMAGSGMCTGGRIKHHLRHNIEREESTVLFVGYQAEETLGRQILEREPQVRIHGRMYDVKARTERIDGFSAHADRRDLLRWLGAFAPTPPRVFLTHGEESVMQDLAGTIRATYGVDPVLPDYGQVVDLDAPQPVG